MEQKERNENIEQYGRGYALLTDALSTLPRRSLGLQALTHRVVGP